MRPDGNFLHDAMMIFRFATMDAQYTNSFGQLRVLAYHHASITERAQILAGKKEKQPSEPIVPHYSIVAVLCAYGLGGIFNEGNSMFAGSGQTRVHLCAGAEKVHRQNRFSACGYFRLNPARVKIESTPVDNRRTQGELQAEQLRRLWQKRKRSS